MDKSKTSQFPLKYLSFPKGYLAPTKERAIKLTSNNDTIVTKLIANHKLALMSAQKVQEQEETLDKMGSILDQVIDSMINRSMR